MKISKAFLRIGIDARFIGPNGTGLGKYTEKLIENLQKIDTQNHYIIFLKAENWQYLKIKNKNFEKKLADVPWYSVQEQIKMPAIFKAANLDVLHVPHFNVPYLYRKKFVVTIHDLIHHHFSQESATTKNPLIFKLKRLGYKTIIANAVSKSSKIITPSKFVKDEILKTFKVKPEKIKVTYEAAEEEYFQSKHPISSNKTILYVGNAYPHKNLNRLLDAVKFLASKSQFRDLKLIIVCPRDVFWQRLHKEIVERNLENAVEMKGYLGANELSNLFQKSTAYVFPSLSEGFGIPGLNAMAAGLPLVSSNIPTLREIYGSAAIFFDPKDPKDIAEKISLTISSSKFRNDLIKKGQKQVKKYSWRKMAKETLEVYKSSS